MKSRPIFKTEAMGSLIYAKRCKERGEKVVAMLSLETIGYFSDEDSSQHDPVPIGLFYPSKGDFLGFVGNLPSRAWVHRVIRSFRRAQKLPSHGIAAPAFIPGIDWSDQWSFWRQGYPGVMVTDTAIFRYPYYHSRDDTPDKIDYDRLARAVAGLQAVIDELVTAS